MHENSPFLGIPRINYGTQTALIFDTSCFFIIIFSFKNRHLCHIFLLQAKIFNYWYKNLVFYFK